MCRKATQCRVCSNERLLWGDELMQIQFNYYCWSGKLSRWRWAGRLDWSKKCHVSYQFTFFTIATGKLWRITRHFYNCFYVHSIVNVFTSTLSLSPHPSCDQSNNCSQLLSLAQVRQGDWYTCSREETEGWVSCLGLHPALINSSTHPRERVAATPSRIAIGIYTCPCHHSLLYTWGGIAWSKDTRGKSKLRQRQVNQVNVYPMQQQRTVTLEVLFTVFLLSALYCLLSTVCHLKCHHLITVGISLSVSFLSFFHSSLRINTFWMHCSRCRLRLYFYCPRVLGQGIILCVFCVSTLQLAKKKHVQARVYY